MRAVLDAEPVVLEELDLAPTCDWLNPTCDRRAAWEAIMDCGCHNLLCDGHADEVEKRMGIRFARVYCPDCGAERIERIEFRRVS